MWSLSGGIFEKWTHLQDMGHRDSPLESPLLSLLFSYGEKQVCFNTPAVSPCSVFQRPAVTEPRHQGMNHLKS